MEGVGGRGEDGLTYGFDAGAEALSPTDANGLWHG
jgi:hypothetical protein